MDARTVDGKREEDVRVAEHVVVKEIFGCSAEIVHIESPSGEGNSESEFSLFIALASQRQKSESLLRGDVEQGPGYS